MLVIYYNYLELFVLNLVHHSTLKPSFKTQTDMIYLIRATHRT